MYGTFGLFNFFQQPNTGVFPVQGGYDVTSVINGVGISGLAADFNWPFPYALTAVPLEIVEGGGGDFQLKLFSDSNVGLRFASINEIISGSFEGDLQKFFSFNNISGTFFPLDSGFVNSCLVFSGLITGVPIDSQTNYIVLSGSIIGVEPDISLPFLVFSGQIQNCVANIELIDCTVSGSITSGNFDTEIINVVFRGNFTPTNQDNCNISYGFTGITSYNNIIVSGTNFENKTCLRYGFSSFVSTRGA